MQNPLLIANTTRNEKYSNEQEAQDSDLDRYIAANPLTADDVKKLLKLSEDDQLSIEPSLSTDEDLNKSVDSGEDSRLAEVHEPFVRRPSFAKGSVVYEIQGDELKVTDCRTASAAASAENSPNKPEKKTPSLTKSVSFAEWPEIWVLRDHLDGEDGEDDLFFPAVGGVLPTTSADYDTVDGDSMDDRGMDVDEPPVGTASIAFRQGGQTSPGLTSPSFLKSLVREQGSTQQSTPSSDRPKTVKRAETFRENVSSQRASPALRSQSVPGETTSSLNDSNLSLDVSKESVEDEASIARDPHRPRAQTVDLGISSRLRSSFRRRSSGSFSRNSLRRNSSMRPRAQTVTSILDADHDVFSPTAKPPSAFRLPQEERLSDTDATLLGYRMGAPEFQMSGGGLESGGVCVEIIPNLYIGNTAGACGAVNIVLRRIRFLVNLTRAGAPSLPVYVQDFNCAGLDESGPVYTNLRPYLKQCSDVISLCQETTYGTLVYSQTGTCSAPAVVLDFLVRHKEMTLDDAMNLVQRKHPITQLSQPLLKHLVSLDAEIRKGRDQAKYVTDLFLKRTLKGVEFLC